MILVPVFLCELGATLENLHVVDKIEYREHLLLQLPYSSKTSSTLVTVSRYFIKVKKAVITEAEENKEDEDGKKSKAHIQHWLSEKVLGQHGGELLLAWNSLETEYVPGMIAVGTKFMSMAPTSPFILFEEKLMEVIKKTPKTSPLEIYILKIYLEMKTETDIVQEVGTKYDSPPLDEKDSCGQNSRKRKEKNRLYTWIKNFITRKTCAPVESFKEKWTRFADANPSVVMQYVISRPRVIEQLQCILDSDSGKFRVLPKKQMEL
ncbi:uncharacterized protein LOC134727673 [Mytilus trossulus]|uniref:uncharacterized protein LOC134727673 n=1 Tax=Mytilus trossulus TaxID=6551 RepID=UPI003007CBB5